jgi:hypothetical protein
LREQRQLILGQLAYEHLLNTEQPTNSLEWVDAIRTIKQLMSCTESEAEAIFLDISKETGLITEERPRQSFRFIHLTFCEFLAAFEAVQGRDTGWFNLIQAHNNFQRLEQPQFRTRLMEVIPFACGLLPRIKRYNAITDIFKLDNRRLLALSFLETKMYDHPSWSTFVESEKNALLSTPEENWDEQWLQQLHLFNVVVRDANHSNVHIPITGGAVEIAEFFRSLVAKQKRSLSTLLSTYAAQDAAAAFRLAEVCNLDLAGDFPEIVASNCDQAPFFAMVREQALSEIARIDLWASLLSEAALRSRVVTNRMNEIESPIQIQEIVSKIPERKKWYKRFVVPLSFYTQILSIATTAGHKATGELLMLRMLSQLPAPGSIYHLPSIFYRWMVILASMSLVLILMLISGRFFTIFLQTPRYFLYLSLLPIFVLELSMLSFVAKLLDIRRGYRALLQLSRNWDQFLKKDVRPVTQPFPFILRLFGLSRRRKESAASFLGKKYRDPIIRMLDLRQSGALNNSKSQS